MSDLSGYSLKKGCDYTDVEIVNHTNTVIEFEYIAISGERIERSPVKTVKIVFPKYGFINRIKRWLKIRSGWDEVEKRAREIKEKFVDSDGEIIAEIVYRVEAEADSE